MDPRGTGEKTKSEYLRTEVPVIEQKCVCILKSGCYTSIKVVPQERFQRTCPYERDSFRTGAFFVSSLLNTNISSDSFYEREEI